VAAVTDDTALAPGFQVRQGAPSSPREGPSMSSQRSRASSQGELALAAGRNAGPVKDAAWGRGRARRQADRPPWPKAA